MSGFSRFMLTRFEPESLHNNARLDSFDIPRAIAIGLMIILHTLMIYASPATLEQPLTKLLMLSGTAPGAPAFMFLMGFYFIYARPKNDRYYLLRGVQLFLLGYLLNILRFIMPVESILLLGISAEVFLPWTPLMFFKTIDILQFAGLALIILTAVRFTIKRPGYILFIIVTVTLISPLLWGIHSGFAALDWVLDMLWGTSIYVTFPLFPWLVYPLAGYLFGQAVINWQSSKTFFQASSLLGLLIFVTGLVWTSTNPGFHFGDYLRAGYGGTVAMLGFVTFYVCSIELLYRQVGIKGRIKGIGYLSDNLTPLYFIHWTIIGWGMLSGYPDKLSLNSCFMVMILVGISSLIVLKGYHNFKENEFTIEGLGNHQQIKS